MQRFLVVSLVGLLASLATAQEKKPRPYRLKSVDLKQPVIWGATCEPGNGVPGLAFGGQDQNSDDGRPHTRIKEGDKWVAIHEDLRKRNPNQRDHQNLVALARQQKNLASMTRFLYLEGNPADTAKKRFMEILDVQELLRIRIRDVKVERGSKLAKLVEQSASKASPLQLAREGLDAKAVHTLWQAQVDLEIAADACAAEPPARALSPIVYDPKSKLFVLFGGDHLDYLTNDLWVFDPDEKRWERRFPKQAPAPRANHTLEVSDGKIILKAGYTYSSSTGYISGQYVDLEDGPFTYDLTRNEWTGGGKLVDADQRTYRTGPFHPDFYLQGPKPDAASFQKKLASLPANTWTKLELPQLPRLNRDWGSAVLDTDRDLILRWSGGHSAHGGSDVLQFHLATGRWELCFPVEFPLGQLYSNTSYPNGFNFNKRPWITGHTYQNYGYDKFSRKMIFTGRSQHSYVYDPDVGDWIGRKPKPKPMVYNSCFYTLTLTPTPEGLVCWTKGGDLFRYDPKQEQWVELELKGKLPGSIVDNSTVVHDGKRNRLVFFRKPYGKAPYDGTIHAVDLKTLEVSEVAVKNKAAAKAVPYLCQIRYDPEHDLLLVGGWFTQDGQRRTPAFDCAKNEWISLALTGDDPNGKNGRNVSLGMMYDAPRKLFWAVDTNGNVFALRLDPTKANRQ